MNSAFYPVMKQTDGIGPQAMVISGATASGKTALSIRLAHELRGEIINGDSVQCYEGWDIGSAKPTIEERQTIPHHLFDIAAPSSSMTAASFSRIALEKIQEVQERQHLPLIVGSSGLYLKALLEGLSPVKEGDANIRQELQSLTNEEGYKLLLQEDPERAQHIHPNDRMRILRALEIARVGQNSVTDQYSQHLRSHRPPTALVIVLVWPREILHQRIFLRTTDMIQRGLINEVQMLLERYPQDHHLFRSVGYVEGKAFLEGTLAESHLHQKITEHTRQYAKRQMTFWRQEPLKRGWATSPSLTFQEHPSGKSQVREIPTLDYTFDQLQEAIRQSFSMPFQKTQVWYLNASRLECPH